MDETSKEKFDEIVAALLSAGYRRASFTSFSCRYSIKMSVTSVGA